MSDQSDKIRAHNDQLAKAAVWVGEAVALASERALSTHDRDTMGLAGQLLVKVIQSQMLAMGQPDDHG